MTRYDERHLREIMATIRAPVGLREKVATTTVDPTVNPTSPARPPRPRWPLPIIVGAVAAGLMFGTVAVANRLTDPRPPSGVVDSAAGPSVSTPASPANPPVLSSPPTGPSTPPAGPGPTATPPAPATGSTVTGVGVPAGASLTVHSGDLTITTAGATVSNLQVNGTVYVAAPNVTLVNLKVTPAANYFGIKQQPEGLNLTVRDSEISGDPHAPTQYGISQSAAGLTVTRVLIRHVESGIALGAGSVTVTASRIDQLAGSSRTGIGSNGDTPNLSFTNNTILIDDDAGGAIALYDTSGPYEGVTIQGNTLAGGARSLIAGQGPGSHDIRVIDNRFSRMYYPNCGAIAPVTAYDPAEPGNLWSGNTWADTGLAVEP